MRNSNSHIVKFEKVVGAKRANDAHYCPFFSFPSYKLSVENEKDPGCGSSTHDEGEGGNLSFAL